MSKFEEEEEEPYLRKICLLMPYLSLHLYLSLSLHLYPCTLPTAPVSRSFGLRSSYKIDILEVFGLAIATPEGDTVTRNGARAEGCPLRAPSLFIN
jgi:hypothetical protein